MTVVMYDLTKHVDEAFQLGPHIYCQTQQALDAMKQYLVHANYSVQDAMSDLLFYQCIDLQRKLGALYTATLHVPTAVRCMSCQRLQPDDAEIRHRTQCTHCKAFLMKYLEPDTVISFKMCDATRDTSFPLKARVVQWNEDSGKLTLLPLYTDMVPLHRYMNRLQESNLPHPNLPGKSAFVVQYHHTDWISDAPKTNTIEVIEAEIGTEATVVYIWQGAQFGSLDDIPMHQNVELHATWLGKIPTSVVLYRHVIRAAGLQPNEDYPEHYGANPAWTEQQKDDMCLFVRHCTELPADDFAFMLQRRDFPQDAFYATNMVKLFCAQRLPTTTH